MCTTVYHPGNDRQPLLQPISSFVRRLGFALNYPGDGTIQPLHNWGLVIKFKKAAGGAEDSYSAWHFFCIRIIQQKVTSHPVRQRATSLPGAKAKIYGNRFFYSVSKMMIFCNRLHILSLFFVHPVKELSLFTSMHYSTV